MEKKHIKKRGEKIWLGIFSDSTALFLPAEKHIKGLRIYVMAGALC